MAVSCKYHAEHVNTVCKQNAELLMLNLVVYMYVCACVIYTVKPWLTKIIRSGITFVSRNLR